MQNNPPGGRRAAGSHCQAGTPGRANFANKSSGLSLLGLRRSTARMSLTAPAQPGSAAQLELGTPDCGRAAARRPGRGRSLS